MRIHAWLMVVLLSFSALACAGLSASSPARRGDIAALRSALQEDFRAGRLSHDAVTGLARDVASHELRTATGNLAVARIQQLRMCTASVADAMRERADGNDDVAALASMALLDAHRIDPSGFRNRSSDPSPAWRALGTRVLTGKRDGDLRRARLLDPDENVRLAAVRAAQDAADPADHAALLDAARRDPNPLVRVQAIRALAVSANAQVVLDLKDLWPGGSEAVRQSIVASWAWPGAFEQGGLREILSVAESDSGTCAIIAGGILLRHGGEARGAGVAALMRAIRSGIARDRALAINMAPVDDPHVLELVRSAANEAEPMVRVAALERLARDPSHRADALRRLGELAVTNSPATSLSRAAMARLGDARVTTLLVEDGKSTNADNRLQAAQSLIDLRDWGRAAQFLADPDVRVRTGTACRLLIAPR
jgi:hypothetical protein